MKALLAKIRMILKDRRTRQLLTRTVSITAALVVFVTTYALVLPAITMESEALCGVEAHQHDDSCYTEELVCGIPESDGHHHTEACYEVSRVLVCGKTAHQHGKSCYDADGKLICGIEEHTHDDVCYKEKRELVCGLKESEGHRHTEDCYRKVLTCGKEIHTHSTECYKDNAAATVMMERAAVASDESSEITEMDFGEEESSELETFAATENEGAFEAGENDPADGDASAFAEEDQFSGEGDRYSGEEDQFPEEEDQVLEEDGEIADSETEEDAYAAADDAADDKADEARENESSESAETDFSTDGEDGENGFAAEAEPAIDGEDGESGSGSADADHSIDGEEESESGTAEESLSTEEDGEDGFGEADLAIGEAGEDESGEAADASGTGAADAETGDESVLHEAGDQTDADSAGTSAAAESETADSAATAAESEIASTAGTEESSADPSATAKEGYVPVLDQLHFASVLNKKTAIYYSHAADQTDGSADDQTDGSADNQTDGSADGAEASLFDTAAQDVQQAGLSLSEGTAPDPAADWKKVNKDTELAPADLLRVYLAYTIPAGELNETNAVARYRLPSGLHLTDDQIRSLNTTVNGIAAQYVDYDKLEILDVEAYNKYLGIEAVEGTRRPSDDIREYLEKNDQQEYISATVKAENVFNEISGELEGQDLIFTFAPYTVMKNRHEYDAEGKPVKAGEKVRGWVCLDLTTDQVDWETSQITTEEIEDEVTPEGTGQEEAQEPAEEAADAETPEGTGQEEAQEPTEEAADSETQEDAAALETEKTEEVTADAEKPEADTEAEAETSDTAAGKMVTIRQVEEKTADIVFAEEDKELGIDEISSKLKMILVQDFVSEEAPASDSEEAAENAGTKDKETSDEKASGEKAAGENTEDNRTGENAGNVNPADYPAATFDDRITVTAGSLNTDTETGSSPEKVTELKVHVEADEGTFPPGTAMRLAEADPDIVAAALEGSVEGRTKGFHAVDISFWSAPGDGSSTEPVEIEPLKPIRVSITSEAIRQAVEDSSTAPLVVHVEDSADKSDKENKADKSDEADAADKADKSDEADIAVKTQDLTETKDAETEGNADTLTFKADSFSVYAVVYTVDFHYEVNGKMYEFSIPGGGFVSFYKLVEVLGIARIGENTADLGKNEAVEAENAPENVENTADSDVYNVGEETGIEKIDANTGSGYEESISLNNVEVSEATKNFVADVKSVDFSNPELASVDPDSWDIVFIRDEKDHSGDQGTLTIAMKDGSAFTIDITITGQKNIDADGIATISSVTGVYLPDDAEGNAAILNEEESCEAIASVKELLDISDNEQENVQYQVFDIGLDGVDVSAYEGGFKVLVNLPENIVGKDFHLYHIHEGMTEEIELSTISKPEEIGLSTVSKSVDETGLESVTGFEFVTDGFSEFVLSYTVEYSYANYNYVIPVGETVTLQSILDFIRYTVPEDVTVSNVEFSGNPTDTGEPQVITIEQSGDVWNLTAVTNFSGDETLTVTFSDGTTLIIAMYCEETHMDSGYSYILYSVENDGIHVLKADGTTEVFASLDNLHKNRLGSEYQWTFYFVYTQYDEGDHLDHVYYFVRPLSDKSKSIALIHQGTDLLQTGANNIAVLPQGNVGEGGFIFHGYNNVELGQIDGSFAGVTGNGSIIHIWQQDPLETYEFTVVSDDYKMGSVTTTGTALTKQAEVEQRQSDGTYKTVTGNVTYYLAETDSDKKNNYVISAVPASHTNSSNQNKWEFDYWDLEGEPLYQKNASGNYILDGTGNKILVGATIAKGTLPIPSNGSVLTAHFKQADADHYTVPNGEKEGSTIESMSAWLAELKNRNVPLNANGAKKSAEVYDYENRIYRVDLTAQSSLTTFDGDIDLGFIIDVSGSMNFPSYLYNSPTVTGVRDLSTINNRRWGGDSTQGQRWGLDTNHTYYIIADPEGTATVCYLYYYSNQWWLCDASKDKYTGNGRFDPETGHSADNTQWYNNSYYKTTSYVIMEAGDRVTQADFQDTEKAALLNKHGLIVGDPKTRAYYLELSLNNTIDELNAILKALSIASNNSSDPDVKIAWNTFRNYLPNGSGQIQHNFVSAKNNINLTKTSHS